MDVISRLLSELDNESAWEGEKILNRNERLVSRGRTDTNLYYVKKGSLRIYICDGDTEHCIRFGYQGSLIAALDSFMIGKPTSLIIQAIKKTELRWISRNSYRQFIRATPERMELWDELLHQFVYQQMEREQDLLTSSPSERYRRVLERSPHLFQEIPHKYIASYLRMTPETLSRIKSLDLNQ